MEFAEVYRTWNEQKAAMIKEILRDYDVECYLSSHITHSVYPIPVNGLGEIRVMFPEEDEERAKEVISNFFQPEEDEGEN